MSLLFMGFFFVIFPHSLNASTFGMRGRGN